jgi:hypothetical protein
MSIEEVAVVTSNNKLVLASGKFKGTTRADLRKAFDTFSKSEQKDTLVIHFHGGVVSHRAAENLAERLMPTYTNAGGYPLFVMWQSGILEVLRNNWDEIVGVDIFDPLIERISQFVQGKIEQTPGERGGAVELPTIFQVQDELNEKRAAAKEPFAELEASASDTSFELLQNEEDQFKDMVAADQRIQQASHQIAEDRDFEINPQLRAELDEARSKAADGEKALVSQTTLILAAVRILKRVLQRLSNDSHHGIYTTVVEEVVREIKGDLIGGTLWKHMKKDTADSFDGSGDEYGGSSLLSEIQRIYSDSYQPRIVLVGHSAGSVYISHFLQEAAKTLPGNIGLEVILLAPGVSFKLLSESLQAAENHISAFRCFALGDALERTDAVFTPVYLRSLLYFVSGLLEAKVDMPLVGMQRYHPGFGFEISKFPEIEAVYQRVSKFNNAWVWAKCQDGSGRNSLAEEHGDLDNEPETMKSVAHLIATGEYL